jgi:hypothetical protein
MGMGIMTNFRKPDAVDRGKEALVETEITGVCWDGIGQPLDHGALRRLPEHNEKLDLRLDPTAERKRTDE